jgi:large subunit ribosomal protein L24
LPATIKAKPASAPSFPDKNRAIVEGVNIVKKHVKATQTRKAASMEMEANHPRVQPGMLLDPKTGEATRAGRREENGERVRYSKKSGNIIK